MGSEASKNKSTQNVNTLATKMAISLIAGLVIGALLLILRENLISNGHESTWNIINNLFFQDIST
ncbi:MAG: dicarboxylate/amino acid:cation symporter, partial [Intestinibacter sp.]